MTYYDAILKLFFFTFVANVQDLWSDNFLVLTDKELFKGFICRGQKRSPQAYTGLNEPKLNRVEGID